MMDQPGPELLARAISGDEHAFEAVVRASYDGVFRMACRYLGRTEDAEDVTQETFLKVARKIHTFRGQSTFSTWLYRIAINTARDHVRKRSTVKTEPYENGVHIPKDAPGSNPGSERDILQAINRLPEKLRETVLLVFGQELSHGEAAGILGVSEGTVSWRIFQAKKKLRKALS